MPAEAEAAEPAEPAKVSAPAVEGGKNAAAVLAIQHRLGLQEARNILDAFKCAKKDENGGLDVPEFRALMCRVFDVSDVADHVLQSAYEESGCWKEVDVNRFLSWYVQNMFLHVNHLNANPECTQGNSLIYRLADRFNVSVMAVDAIKAQFDRFDTNKSGEIDFDAFAEMMRSLLSAKKECLGELRLKKFWREIVGRSNGGVTFERFTMWYMKYFVAGVLPDALLPSKCACSAGPLEAFHSSIGHTSQRQASCH